MATLPPFKRHQTTSASSTVKTLGILAAVVIGFVLIHHAYRAMQPTVPKDQPKNAVFAPDHRRLSNEEPQGNWVACHLDADRATDHCRVTTEAGIVVYEDDFLPLQQSAPLPDADLQIAAVDAKALWVEGVSQRVPVPAIPLKNGMKLVPAMDRVAMLNHPPRPIQ